MLVNAEIVQASIPTRPVTGRSSVSVRAGGGDKWVAVFSGEVIKSFFWSRMKPDDRLSSLLISYKGFPIQCAIKRRTNSDADSDSDSDCVRFATPANLLNAGSTLLWTCRREAR
jgi:hypothetical protein